MLIVVKINYGASTHVFGVWNPILSGGRNLAYDIARLANENFKIETPNHALPCTVQM